MTLSVLNLLAFTVARMFVVIKPMQKRLTVSKTKKICVMLWIVSGILVFCYYFLMKYGLSSQAKFSKYEMLVFPTATYIATVAFIYCYCRIFTTVKKQTILFRSKKRRNGIKNFQEHDRRIKLRHNSVHEERETQFRKLAFLTVSAFVICWAPVSTYALLKAVDVYKSKDVEFS